MRCIRASYSYSECFYMVTKISIDNAENRMMLVFMQQIGSTIQSLTSIVSFSLTLVDCLLETCIIKCWQEPWRCAYFCCGKYITCYCSCLNFLTWIINNFQNVYTYNIQLSNQREIRWNVFSYQKPTRYPGFYCIILSNYIYL